MLTKEPFEKKCRNKIFYNSAREAFYELLKQIDLKQDEYILMPSYIGQSLKEGSGVFDPIRRLKLNYKFYKLNALLNINFKDIESQCNKYKIKVIFIINYFLFITNYFYLFLIIFYLLLIIVIYFYLFLIVFIYF